MPRTDAVLTDVRRSGAFAAIGFCYGYWKLPLHDNSQPLHALLTPDGIMKPTRKTQGCCNSAVSFQECVELSFAEVRENILAWMDDFAVHAKDETALLKILDRFLAIWAKRNLVTSLQKPILLSRAIKLCDLIMDVYGFHMGLENYNGVPDSIQQNNASELCDYLHFMSWMSNAIPRFAERAEPPYQFMEIAWKMDGRRMKKTISKLSYIQPVWEKRQDDEL